MNGWQICHGSIEKDRDEDRLLPAKRVHALLRRFSDPAKPAAIIIDCRRDRCPYFLGPESGDELTGEDTVLLSGLFQIA
jgi:hypothetical protein